MRRGALSAPITTPLCRSFRWIIWSKLVRLWRSRFLELKATPGIRYVLIFENKGAVIGVTMPHPHGQIYSFPFIPPRLEKELSAARDHQRRHGRCLYCDILKKERRDGRRIIAENDAFTALIPFLRSLAV